MSEDLRIPASVLSKKEKYEILFPQIESLVAGETDLISNLANITAALKYGMDWLWVGFYFVKKNNSGDDELVLGPFQGPIACTRIAYGRGVCGTSWKNKEVVIVDDVEKFPGHIACNSLSKSEIVLPVFKNENVMLIFDIDSEQLSTFDAIDKYFLGKITVLVEAIL